MLKECPTSPNCVSTLTQYDEKKMPAIAYKSDSIEMAKSKVKQVIGQMPRTELISETEDYLHFTFTSLIFRFKDDVEFYIDGPNKLIHFRSASRTGYSDLGANKKRMKKVTERLTGL